MLKDPLVVTMLTGSLTTRYAIVAEALGSITDPDDLLELHTLDISLGASTRRAEMADGTKVQLTIKHSQSNENKPVETVRTLVRFDFTKLNPVSLKPVTLSTYAVIALPQDNTFTAVDAERYAESMSLFLLQGGFNSEASAAPFFDPQTGKTLVRLLGGEA